MKLATRDAFGAALRRLGEENADLVVLDADLSESTRSAKFAEAFPERFFEMGIQEANMLGTAAGLAASGKKAFCCSFACFVTGRFDQIKVSVAYNEVDVTIVGTHAGCGIGDDGYTQMGLEDIGVMRTLPNVLVLQPADDIETERMVEHLVREHRGPAYLRLTRQKVPRVHAEDHAFTPGAPVPLREGSDLLICASGATVGEALAAAEALAEEGISAAVANISTIAPLDAAALAALAEGPGRVLAVEDHAVTGGMGSAVCEALAETHPVPVRRVGLRTFGESGDAAGLYAKHHLDAAGIREEARLLLGR